MGFIDLVIKFLNDNMVVIGSVLGFIFGVAKVASNSKAGPVIALIQKWVDLIAVGVQKVGLILKAISDLLSNAIKSDGFLGKK